jgi:glycosyltransferase involved in cell wall biosynthesis
VTASTLEGTSPALVAAMGAGNCVLVNAIPENIETIGTAGLYFEENNIHDLTEKMIFLIGSPNLVRDYGIKAMAHAREKYSWDEIARRYEEVFIKMEA